MCLSTHSTFFWLAQGTGPHGITVIVSAISDNKARTVALIKEAFNKGGGNMTLPNSVGTRFSAPTANTCAWIPIML
jgi:transcriptional/translational regulatory protein YebC/TACO1